MIDLHCHILPGCDDGPSEMDASVAMARAASAAGTETVVATPHVSADYPRNTAGAIAAGVAELNAALQHAGVAVQVLTGAEVAVTQAALLPDDELVALRLGGGEATHLLIECPLTPIAPGFEDFCLELLQRGHRILLAHPERCPVFHRDPSAYRRLIAAGMVGQVTAGALVGRFGRTVQADAKDLLRNGLAHVVASDGHSAVRRRPSIRAELLEAGYARQATWLTVDVPSAVLSGAAVPSGPPMPTVERSHLDRLLGR